MTRQVMKKSIWILLNITFYALTSIGQDSSTSSLQAQEFFESYVGDCKSTITANNCIHLDVTESYDFEGKEFTFLWEMGDGTELEGMEVNHCYDKPGQYIATLSLLDPMTKVTIEEEAKVDISIKGAFELRMNTIEVSEASKPVNFDYHISFPQQSYKIENIYWHFGDGTFSSEKTPQHMYEVPGLYKTDLIIKLSSGQYSEILCSSDTINIKTADPSQGLLTEIFNSTKVDSRFLADNVHYKILMKQNNTFEEVANQDSMKKGRVFKLLSYRGRLIYGSSEITTEGAADNNEVMNIINTHAKSLAQSEPLNFNPVIFELDQSDLSKKNKKTIRKNIDLLIKFPMLQLAIGVYTNSKGSLAKGIDLSIQRAGLIKSYMVEQGINERRVRAMNPGNTRSLINSCVTGTSCDYADPALDRRADFKILGELIN